MHDGKHALHQTACVANGKNQNMQVHIAVVDKFDSFFAILNCTAYWRLQLVCQFRKPFPRNDHSAVIAEYGGSNEPPVAIQIVPHRLSKVQVRKRERFESSVLHLVSQGVRASFEILAVDLLFFAQLEPGQYHKRRREHKSNN